MRKICPDNFWSESHRKMLYYVAAVCCKMFRYSGRNIELDDLVAAAWLDCARRDESVEGCARYFLVAMVKHVRKKILSLNGLSKIKICYLEEMEGEKFIYKNKINHTKEVDARDNVEHILSLIPKESTRYMFQRHFIDGIHKAQIAREVGIGECSVGSRIERALVELRKKGEEICV